MEWQAAGWRVPTSFSTPSFRTCRGRRAACSATTNGWRSAASARRGDRARRCRIPHWQRFGIQRHFNTMQPEDVARAVVTVVTAPEHMWVPIVEVQPNPPLDTAT